MNEQENEFSNKLRDDILGLRDSVEVADWNHAAEIATEISRDGAECGWPLVTKIADYLLQILKTSVSHIPEDVIELHIDAFELCLSKNLRQSEGEGAELMRAIEKLAAQSPAGRPDASQHIH